ncbi:CGNR zinc finger domain-containing protein [Streptomyces sp. NRRL F-5053]|uniref:CGNR zinc finger domain-containing protein n=1 Tax=Streptomyces sp. NRRL F-5053 TaxID=1463854 RepID=UPI000AC06564
MDDGEALGGAGDAARGRAPDDGGDSSSGPSGSGASGSGANGSGKGASDGKGMSGSRGGSSRAGKGSGTGAGSRGGNSRGSGGSGSRKVVHGGFRPGERLIELANAVREDPELSRDGLAALLSRHGETEHDLAELSTAEADELRSAVAELSRRVLSEADPDRAAEALNALLERCGARPRLSRHDGHAWHLHVDRGDDASWADWFTATGALALAQLLSEQGRTAWGECAAEGCRTLFLDTGPGARRRYCSTTCASRTRVAAHRLRRRAQGTENPTAPRGEGAAAQADERADDRATGG